MCQLAGDLAVYVCSLWQRVGFLPVLLFSPKNMQVGLIGSSEFPTGVIMNISALWLTGDLSGVSWDQL